MTRFVNLTSLAALLGVLSTPVSAQPACHAIESDHLRALEGSWSVDWRYRVAPGEWLDVTATSSVRKDLMGCALVERFTAELDTIPYHAISIFTEPAKGRFDRLTVDSQHGGLMKHDGHLKGDTLVFVWQTKLGNLLVRTRHTFFRNAQGVSVREQYLSRGEEATWELRQRMVYNPFRPDDSNP